MNRVTPQRVQEARKKIGAKLIRDQFFKGYKDEVNKKNPKCCPLMCVMMAGGFDPDLNSIDPEDEANDTFGGSYVQGFMLAVDHPKMIQSINWDLEQTQGFEDGRAVEQKIMKRSRNR